MGSSTKSIRPLTVSALALPAKSRARLAEKLLASLDEPNRGELDALWAEEAEDRINAYESGEMRSIPGREVFRALKSRKR
jgi:putative addiction module component (TIGR02574 family)